jgi:hypothetical protein
MSRYELDILSPYGNVVGGIEIDDEDSLGLAIQALAPTILKNGTIITVSVNEI